MCNAYRGVVLVGTAVPTFEKLTMLTAGVLTLVCTGTHSCRTGKVAAVHAFVVQGVVASVLACLDDSLSEASLGQPTWVQTGQPGCRLQHPPVNQKITWSITVVKLSVCSHVIKSAEQKCRAKNAPQYCKAGNEMLRYP